MFWKSSTSVNCSDKKVTTVFLSSKQNRLNYGKNQAIKPYCVLIDEAQFLKRHHVYDLARVVDELDVPVMAFGLKNDFRNELFEGSKHLLLLADKIEEIKTICQYCSRKATMVLRTQAGKPVYDGEQIQIGGHETYISVCRKHYFNPDIPTESV